MLWHDTDICNGDMVMNDIWQWQYDVIIGGVTYTFELTAKDPLISNVTGRASVLVVTNAAPTGMISRDAACHIPIRDYCNTEYVYLCQQVVHVHHHYHQV